MATDKSIKSVEINGISVKYSLPQGDGPHPVIVLIHGWTGNEDSMWVFANHLPIEYLLVAPRGIYQTKGSAKNEYSWVKPDEKKWSSYESFYTSVADLRDLFNQLGEQITGDFHNLSLLGFSQGAALSFAFARTYPERVNRVVAVAGFIPDNTFENLNPEAIAGIDFFISHGAKDEVVPIDRALEAKTILSGKGANVQYCESDGGHKINRDCLRSVKQFFE